MNTIALRNSLKQNLDWFEKSGVMDPADGSWGVAERIVLKKENGALEKTLKSFPAHLEYESYAILEHRRPDCNFEAALMYVTAAKVFNDEKYTTVARNILCYLYRRSGMRNANHKFEEYPPDVWRWSHSQWVFAVWFDDNAWNCVIPMIISRLNPELDKEFQLFDSGVKLAEKIYEAFESHFPECPSEPGTFKWSGDLKSPHWGAMAIMALAFACMNNPNIEYERVILQYTQYLDENINNFTASERAYGLIGVATAASIITDKSVLTTAHKYANSLLDKMDQQTGNIPSEWGKEAPTGKHLVDLVYTLNWSLLGFYIIHELTGDEKYDAALEKILGLLIKIQDKSEQSHLFGCWRGMYDMNADCWGGGDCYEGGAASIYTGWTNAPIAIVIVARILNLSLFNIRKITHK